MYLRDVELGDLDTYVRLRCDPVVMAELGGPLLREGIEAKVRRDVGGVASGLEWIKMIVVEDDPAEGSPHAHAQPHAQSHAQPRESVAGTVVLWSHKEDDADDSDDAEEPFSETGWMVLPEFQGRGLAKRAERELLRLAHADGRWGLVHAFPERRTARPTASAARSASASSARAT